MDFPDELKRKDGEDEQEEDVLPVGLGQGNRPFVNLNQSIFGLIAAAGPKVDFHNRFEGHSSEEEDPDDSDVEGPSHKKSKYDATTDPMAQTTILVRPSAKGKTSHRRKFSGDKLMKSVPMLSRLSTKSRSKKEGKQPVAQIQEESEPESTAAEQSTLPDMHDENRLAPVMSRMLEARAVVNARPSFEVEREPAEPARETSGSTETGPTELSKRLQRIFELDEPEDLISGLTPVVQKKD